MSAKRCFAGMYLLAGKRSIGSCGEKDFPTSRGRNIVVVVLRAIGGQYPSLLRPVATPILTYDAFKCCYHACWLGNFRPALVANGISGLFLLGVRN